MNKREEYAYCNWLGQTDCGYSLDDLQKAAFYSNYTALKKCLKEDKQLNNRLNKATRKRVLGEALTQVLYGVSARKSDTQCIDCFKLLMDHGAEFQDNSSWRYDTESDADIFGGDDGEEVNLSECNKKVIYNVVKFALVHGGGLTLSEGDHDLLDESGIMKDSEYAELCLVGNMYHNYKKTNVEGKEPDEKTFENWLRIAKRMHVNDHLADAKENAWYDNSKEVQANLSKAENEKIKVYQKLAQGTTDRNNRADELKQAMRERDASNSKKTLRAFLKEKSEKKVSKVKTPKRSVKKQAEYE